VLSLSNHHEAIARVLSALTDGGLTVWPHLQVSCMGDAVKLSQADPASPVSFKALPHFPRLRVLLTNTNVPRRTSALVGRVKTLYEAPSTAEVTRRIFEGITAACEQFLALVSSSSEVGPVSMNTIGQLIRMNHGLLSALQVSAPALERVCELADSEGLPTKLTGAGGGGCAFSLIGSSSEGEAAAQRVQAKL